MHLKLTFLCFVAALPFTSGHAAEYNVGDQVVVIEYTDLTRSDGGSVDHVEPAMLGRVQRVMDGRLLIHVGKSGWIDASDVRPLTGEIFETTMLKLLDAPLETIYRRHGLLWLALGQKKTAAVYLDRAVKYEKSASNYFARAHCYKHSGEYEKAIADYKRAIALSDRYVSAIIGLGTVYSLQEKYEKSIKCYTSALEIAPNTTPALILRGNDLSETCEYTRALSDLTAAISLGDRGAFLDRGFVHRKAGMPEAAINDFTEVIRDTPRNPTPYLVRGLLYRGIGDEELAESDFQMVRLIKNE